MPTTPKVKVSDFTRASRSYVETELKKANLDGNASISLAEAARLPKDLQDNFVKHARVSVSKKTFISDFMKSVTDGAKKADGNKDGYLTLSDGKKLPEAVRDNFKAYVAATKDVFNQGTGVNVKDTTKASTIAAHQSEYGDARVSYKDAFKKAIDAVLKSEDGETPRAILKEFAEPPMTRSQLDAEMKKIFKGLELLPVGEASESGGEPGKDWIFSVDADAGSDHGFWVSVSRETGEATVSGFN
ncbi:MAG: hypothetical protein JNM17_14255 [Archangium sp.]|nr:hypothetical protein [Archangium sp.]